MLQLGLLFSFGLTEENWDEATAFPKSHELCWGEGRKIVSTKFLTISNVAFPYLGIHLIAIDL